MILLRPRHYQPTLSHAMRPQDAQDTFGCVIVGGGIHGTYLSQRLLEDTELERSEISILDPHDRLLASFRRKARSCGMDTLRSTYVQHVGTEPFGLESFAEAHDRTDELHPTVDYPDRPSVELFLDYAEDVIETKSLDRHHRQAALETARERPDGGLRLTTSTGEIETHSCILAIGHGEQYRMPEWAAGLEDVEHVWDGFDLQTALEADGGDTADKHEEIVIVGGGITAAQLACTLSEHRPTTVVSRHPLEWEVSEAEPPWLNWHYIEQHLHGYPPASKQRLEAVREARYSATIPPHLYETIDCRLETGRLRILQGEIETATPSKAGLRLALDDGLALEADQVVCATGFEPIFGHPLVERLVAALDLECGYCGLPMVDDATLAWQTTAGRSLPLYVSGALALGVVGPYAPNIPGARRTADRITTALETDDSGLAVPTTGSK